MKRNKYNTKQKELILNIVRKKQKEFTIKEIYEELNTKVGLTTIYRLVDNLVSEGYLEKFMGESNTTYYGYIEKCMEENHFYLKCDRCGSMVHIDCDCINELSSHILSKHKFKPNKEHIIFNGICEKCSREG